MLWLRVVATTDRCDVQAVVFQAVGLVQISQKRGGE
jgi:hypothetical protein